MNSVMAHVCKKNCFPGIGFFAKIPSLESSKLLVLKKLFGILPFLFGSLTYFFAERLIIMHRSVEQVMSV